MALSLNAEQKTLINIFNIQEQYVIPPYQRPYMWGYEECKTLYDDIMNSFKDKDEEDYFVGSIVIAKNENNLEELEVIDGQQRLITLLIFIKVLSVLEKHPKLENCLSFVSWDDSVKKRIRSDVFEVDDDSTLEKILNYNEDEISKILLKCQDNKNKIMEKKCSDKFERNIVYFYVWMNYFINNEKGNLKEFREFLLRKVYLLPISLDGKTVEEARTKALKIFETLNNRGIELADADTFKALLYERARKVDKEDEFIEEWKNFKTECDQLKLGMDDVFRHYSHIVRGRNGKVTSEINLREFFTREDYSPLNGQSYQKTLDELMKVVKTLKYIRNEMTTKSSASKWLQILDRYTNQYPKHALIVYLYIYGDEERGLVDFLIKLVRFSYFHGSTASIKFEIFTIIKTICDKKIENLKEYYNEDMDAEDLNYLGRLKNGYALLCYYLKDESIVIPNSNIDKIVKIKDMNLLDASWDKMKISESNDSLGNLVVLDIPLKNIAWDKKAAYYDSSEITEVKQLSAELENFTYEKFKKRDDRLKKELINFFKGENTQ